MKGDKEFSGKLVGFDDYVNMVLEDVTEYDSGARTGGKSVVHSKHAEILLNGNGICMVRFSFVFFIRSLLTCSLSSFLVRVRRMCSIQKAKKQSHISYTFPRILQQNERATSDKDSDSRWKNSTCTRSHHVATF
jgi:U6 snRNA-associated Sm-like protein LSm5